MKPDIENLKVWMSGRITTGYQRALAMREFKQLLTYVAELEQLRQPLVSGALPVDSAIKEIENLMERWHLARDNDDETLQGINDVLVNMGLLGWFNRQ